MGHLQKVSVMEKQKKDVFVPKYFSKKRKVWVSQHWRRKVPKGRRILTGRTVRFVTLRDEYGRLAGLKRVKQ